MLRPNTVLIQGDCQCLMNESMDPKYQEVVVNTAGGGVFARRKALVRSGMRESLRSWNGGLGCTMRRDMEKKKGQEFGGLGLWE